MACHHTGTGQLVLKLFFSLLCIFTISDGPHTTTVDAPDFFESSFWKDSNPVSGLGGWGDPNADFSVPDGGFDEFHLSYPSSHILRRNFTLYPFAVPEPLFTDKQEEGNATFSVSVIEAALETSAGDYKGFQKSLEIPEVRS
jgi:tyrosinase